MKTLLFKPFEKYSENKLLIIGIIATIIGTYFAYIFNLRFNGALDVHIVKETSIKQSIIDNLINLISLITLFYIAGKYINTKTRLIDIISTVVVSRIPYYTLPLLNFNNILSDATNGMMKFMGPESVHHMPVSHIIILIAFTIISILMVIWYITLLYNGFKIATNAKEKSSTVLFIVALITAEILSLILIYNFN